MARDIGALQNGGLDVGALQSDAVIAPIVAIIKGKGKGSPPLRIPTTGSSSFASGSQAVLTIASDFVGTAILYNSSGVSQGSMTLDSSADNPADIHSLIFSKYVPDAGDYYAIFSMTSGGSAAGALIEIQNVATTNQLDQVAGTTGTGTAPSSGATAATTQAYEIVVGAIGTEGPGTDNQGTWSNSFQPIAYLGNQGAAPASNTTLSLAYKIVSATGAQTAAKTGITSRDWAAAVATYKGLEPTPPVSDPLEYISTSPLASGAVGSEYNEFMEATGGTAPYTFAVTAGSLPDGLSLATQGDITGTPTVEDTFNFTITVTDAALDTVPTAFAITVSGAAPVTVVPGTWFLPPTTQIPANIQIIPQV